MTAHAERPAILSTPRKLTEAHIGLIRLLAQGAVTEYLRHVAADLENQPDELQAVPDTSLIEQRLTATQVTKPEVPR